MGKGDRRSRRGKLFRGTFGKSRKHKVTASKGAAAASSESSEAPKKKSPRKKKEE